MKVLVLLLFFELITFSHSVCGQSGVKKIGNRTGTSFAHFLMEPKEKVSGILLLLPGLGENPKNIFQKTSLPTLIAEYGFITIVPHLGNALFADSSITTSLDLLIKSYIDKHNWKERPVLIGGFSRGGSISLRYAEHLIASHSTVNLMAVFAIDPALDLERLYRSSVRKTNYDCSGLIKREGAITKNYLEGKLSGPPENEPENYITYSAYSATVDSGGNAKFLKDIPLRLYSEPDLDFVRKKYCVELQEEDINAYDLERLHSLLQELGNERCAYITTKGRGFHSWNILEAKDCVEWILKIVN